MAPVSKMLDDIEISRAIIERYSKKFLDCLELDVAIVGAGPAGLTAAYYLAKARKKVVVFERKLSVGGGMWGGGMMYNEIVVQKEAADLLRDFGIRTEPHGKGYYTADSIECVSGLCYKTISAGAKIMNLISIEDVKFDGKRINGLVINWSAVEMAKLHVDPLTIGCTFAVDASGHALEVVRRFKDKTGEKLLTTTGDVIGERPMWAERGERAVIENAKEVYPGLYVCGMAANAAFGDYRMGPIFGGMLLSGKRVAEVILKKFDKK
jgi:sulfide-dependent adenosine diphosphate thiazole synthase